MCVVCGVVWLICKCLDLQLNGLKEVIDLLLKSNSLIIITMMIIIMIRIIIVSVCCVVLWCGVVCCGVVDL